MIPDPVKEFIRLNTDADERPSSFSMFGRQWDLLSDVFAPVYDISTMLFTAWLPLSEGNDLLEVGCGAGVTAVMAATRGCHSVIALDINPAAVENTRRNARRHGVGDRVHVTQSDLFSAVTPTDRYDIIYWNSSFVEAPADTRALTPVEMAVLDPGYRTHKRFLAEAPQYLKPNGRIFLGFSSLGNSARLQEMAAVHEIEVRALRSSSSALSAGTTYQLLELVPAERPTAVQSEESHGTTRGSNGDEAQHQ
ncbi:methyltransferase [Streptomyces sp. MB09-02B]|uniref:methyltransferase n=1 Tax=Streptomyces sp. MB09-02B TaxID=3028667 RepID=UPI0029A082CE|nr:methyltransferase [Streptomyces sp. MB09-02B]MDX3638429.1 methyltransferase [Streptomyces sp. MB09-02B]